MITTVNRQLAQQIVATVQDICGHDINFINQKGIIFASTNEQRIGTFHEIGKKLPIPGQSLKFRKTISIRVLKKESIFRLHTMAL